MTPRGLDPAPSDAELLQRYEAQQAKTPITLGPLSPLRPDTQPRLSKVRRKPVRSGPSEHELQAALFALIDSPLEQLHRPDLAMVHAVPNGASASSMAAAAKRRNEGQKPGVPDIDCPVARGGYFGLRIEMKRPGGTTTPEQAHWMSALAREGYKVALHTTVEGAWAEIITYLDEPRTMVHSPFPPLPAA